MTKLLVCLLFAAAVVAANPYVMTVLSEVSVDPAHQFVELHGAPGDEPVDLNGWRLVTSMSVCTLTHDLQYDEFLVVDSEALALGVIGHGTLRLNPFEDSLFLLDDTGGVAGWVRYPRYPTGHGKAPLPPIPGSIAFWNYIDGEDQSMNWYVDSTPTPGWENDDYGSITGTVTGTGGVTLDEACVYASGTNGRCHCGLHQQTGYTVSGLGAGTYEVKVYAYHQGQLYQAAYPESVVVGYSHVVGGIDFVLPVSGVAEAPAAPLPPLVRISGRALLLSGDGTATVDVQLYNQIGSRVSEFHLGSIEGEKRIELPSALGPGVYFANCRFGNRALKMKLVFY